MNILFTKIFIIGPMGVGKTTVGNALANALNSKFFDVDKIIEERCGADVSWIFDVEGEDGFRKREVNVIDEYTKINNIVLATGGGAILSEDIRHMLSSRGVVIYLNAGLDYLIERTKRDDRRPLLRNNKKEVLSDLVNTRKHLYESIADITVKTDGNFVNDIVNEIIEKLQKL